MEKKVSKLLKKAKQVAARATKKVKDTLKTFSAEQAVKVARPILHRAIGAASKLADPIVEASIGRKAKIAQWGKAWYGMQTLFTLSTMKDARGTVRYSLKALNVKGPKPKSAESEQPIASSAMTVIKYSLGLFGSKDAGVKAREDALARTVGMVIRRGAESWAKSNGYTLPKSGKGRPVSATARIAFALGNKYAPFNFGKHEHVNALAGLFDPDRIKVAGLPVGDIHNALVSVSKALAAEARKQAEAEAEAKEKAKDAKAKAKAA